HASVAPELEELLRRRIAKHGARVCARPEPPRAGVAEHRRIEIDALEIEFAITARVGQRRADAGANHVLSQNTAMPFERQRVARVRSFINAAIGEIESAVDRTPHNVRNDGAVSRPAALETNASRALAER